MPLGVLLALAPLLPGTAPGMGEAPLRPIRTNEPGTGVFIGNGLLGQIVAERRSSGGERFWDATWSFDFRYTPATHWVFGVRVPWVLHRSLDHPQLGSQSTRGLGDIVVSAKHRFFRSVGPWSDRHAAVEVNVELPTGSTDEPVDARLPIQRRKALQPGTGSTDVTVDVVYQEGRRRFVYGGDLAYRINGEDGDGYRFGNELRLNLDFEYILLPLEYTRPGKEVFVLIEATVLHKRHDELGERALPGTDRTELLLAPGIQHIAGEQLLVSLSVQVPVWSRVGTAGLERDINLLGEFRYAF